MQLICTISLLLAAGHSLAAASMEGVVLDPAGRTAPRVKVTAEPGGRWTLTDSRGLFRFDGLPAGEYSLRAQGAGFEDAIVRAVAKPDGESVRIEIRFQRLSATHVQLDVLGDRPEATLRETPGSAAVITREEMAARDAVDANQILRCIPGLHVREDSGPVGMRLNIGVRGLNPDRSRSLLVLEDGLPLALAPYGEPEMYYSPPIERMSGMEVLKGSGSIIHGPQTIGGVLNFLTPDPPPGSEGAVQLQGGQYGLFSGQASWGGTRDNTGWFVNLLRKQGDGWRDFYFHITDVTAKLNVVVTDWQRLGFKLNAYDERSNSTYLGLTEAQFRVNPSLNLVPDDFLKVRRLAASLQHQWIAGPSLLLTSSAFAYTTTRNWRRQDFDRRPVAGIRYRTIAGDPGTPGGAIYLRNSSGNNNREFDVAGLDWRLTKEYGLGSARHRLEAGWRYVYEEHRDRRIDGASFTASSGVIREDEVRHGRGLSGFVQNRIFLTARLTLTPGLRIERYDYSRHILRQPVGGVPSDVDIRKGDMVSKAIPGAGLAWQPGESLTLFAGVHRGFAPPRVKDAITRSGVSLELDAELSWNYEAGARWRLPGGMRGEATYFRTNFQNQIIPAAQSGGAATTLINGGETLHEGAEFALASGAWRGFHSEARYTLLAAARFQNGIYRGNRLPYAPRHSLSLIYGWRHKTGWRVHADGTRVGSQFADNAQTRTPSPDGTTGLIPAYWVWNLSAGRQFERERVTIEPFVTVKNLFDAIYISSRAPQGIQPGMFRQLQAGLKCRFR
jgi:Fe(3+) dicitrate transport protein